jgi:D-methionine transport system substrate-binding protein
MLSGCHQSTPTNTLLVGTLAGPETELVQVAQKIANDRYGLTVKIIEFNDYNLPNEALNDGSLDANVYQHAPYLEAANQARGYQLIPIGKTFLYPVGLYSQRFKSLETLPQHALIALPNDPSNEARALMLLEQAHLITLQSKTKTPGLHDILTNSHDLQFKVLDAAQLPRILPDVDAAIINTTFALPAGLSPTRDALVIENKESPYANIIVARKDSPKKQQLDLFVKAFQSDEVKEKAKQLFKDAAIAAW